LIVGVTGGVGSGKTSFVRELERCGATVLDADDIASTIVEENQEIRDSLKQAFGDDIFDITCHLQRRKLGQIVFSDSKQLSVLNLIIQPLLVQSIRSRVVLFRKEHPNGIAVIDMAILYEAGMDSLCDQIIVVTAPLSSRQAWLMKDRGWSLEETKQRISAQMDVKIKREKADVVIENTGSLEELVQKARSIYQALTN